jgi:hypothetical protein
MLKQALGCFSETLKENVPFAKRAFQPVSDGDALPELLSL